MRCEGTCSHVAWGEEIKRPREAKPTNEEKRTTKRNKRNKLTKTKNESNPNTVDRMKGRDARGPAKEGGILCICPSNVLL